jgi:lysozyme
MTISQQRLTNLNCVLGLDCSKYQKDITWSKAKAAGVDFAFIKITEGTTGHEDNIYNLKGRALTAQAAGVKVGYYHFTRPGNVASPEDDANEEITNILNHTAILPAANLPLVLDLEVYSDSNIWDNKIDHMNRYINTFISKLGKNVILYSNKSFFEDNTSLSYGTYPLWIAAYLNNPEINLPKIPNTWSEWKIWQFTEKGQIDGYNGGIDLNIMKKDFFNKF